MSLTLIEKILANHSDKDVVKPGEIIDIEIDVRAARDFGGANVVKNLINNGLEIDDPSKTFLLLTVIPPALTRSTPPTSSIAGFLPARKASRSMTSMRVSVPIWLSSRGWHIPDAPLSPPILMPTFWVLSAPLDKAWATAISPQPGPVVKAGSRYPNPSNSPSRENGQQTSMPKTSC